MSTAQIPFLRFAPIYQSRVWGGRRLADQFHRKLPAPETPFGEAWEISAREEADSVVTMGPLAGRSLSALWGDSGLRESIFGLNAPDSDRFPLLCKILDARDTLSIQVHPPARIADSLNGEPKSEVWYIAHAEPGARLYIGVKEDVSPEKFELALEEGAVAECVHAIEVEAGQHIYIPSGRLHAIGAGLLIYEIQQNSDTTYRVFDWNRVGLDGTPRQLHIEESMQCIDFEDIEPSMDQPQESLLTDCDYFRFERHAIQPDESVLNSLGPGFAILTVESGGLICGEEQFQSGDFLLLPAEACEGLTAAPSGATLLVTRWPGN
ncbi:MAG: type I phosphomannose isomerase catalytic subunit [Verrucomicrobiota bacterium]